MKIVLILCVISVASFASAKSTFVGGRTELKGNQLETAKQILNSALTKIVADGGPSLTLVQVNSGTVQVVAGALYALNVDLEDKNGEVKNCSFEIWSRPWLNKNQVTYSCPGEN